MDMNLYARLFEGCAEYSCEHSATLPDYYPPITKMVRTLATPAVTACTLHGSTLTASGTVTLCLLYQTEDGKGLCAYTTRTDFTQSFSLPEEYEGHAFAHTKLTEVTCKLQGARRAQFRVSFGVYGQVVGARRLNLPDANEKDLLHLQKSAGVRVLSGCAVKSFHLSERGESDVIPAAVLYTEADCAFVEFKPAGTKLVVKGEMYLRSVFVTEGDDLGFVSYVFPFSQLLESANVSEGCDIDIDFAVGAIEVELSENMDGSKGRFDYEVEVTMRAIITRCETCDLVLDAFSPHYELEQKREKLQLETLSSRQRGQVDLKSTLELDENAGTPVDVSLSVASVGCTVSGRAAKVEGEFQLGIMLCEEDGRIHSIEKTDTFSFDISLPEGQAVRRADVRLSVASLSFEGAVTVRTALRYELAVYDVSECEYLAEMAVDTARPLTPVVRPPISVYFAEKGEGVWDIAKRYLISPEKIRSVNGLEGDVITENRRLLLPRWV